MDVSFVVVTSTLPSSDKAAEIARVLVREGLIACMSILPQVRSVYFWDGELCDAAEVMCIMKTRADRIDALCARLLTLHPYEVPEFLVLDVKTGYDPYLSWIDASCR
jgi:periplasmic divalent cation tolerance protein